jgi:hypothetical protein
MAMSVYDGLAEDEVALAAMEGIVRTEEWPAAVVRAGGCPVGEPEVTREPNPSYGYAFQDEDGNVLLGADGEPLIDRAKLLIIARGRAVRGC